jgi:curved DNA-binding protein CbpA
MNQAELKASIEEMERRLKGSTLYELLGVSTTASEGEIRAAYRALARLYHVDAYGGQFLGPLVPRMEVVLGELTKAQAKLINPEERAEYDARLALQAQGVPTEVRIIFEADEIFRAGKRLLERNNFAEALLRFRKAFEMYPAEPDYQAYLRWCEYCTLETDKHGRPSNQSAVGRLRDILVDIANKNPKLDMPRVFLANIHRNDGNVSEATTWYREALERNPDNLEARSALRLLNLRDKGKQPESSFLSRLFGKKS